MKLFKAVNDKAWEYSLKHTSPQDSVLTQIERKTHLNQVSPYMISGHYQGGLLKMISQMLRPKQVLEIGTFTGYSAVCLTAGLVQGGCVHTIEVNEELEETIQNNICEAGVKNSVKLYIGDARDIIPSIDVCFDLVFMDANKEQYEAYYNLILDKIRPNGFLLIDNALWHGRIFFDKPPRDAQIVAKFNAMIQADNRVENILLPVRDGIMLVRKK